MKPYFADETVTLWHGANLDVLPHIADGSIDCMCTSPPYFGLRDYGVEGQYGAEETPAEFVANLVATFREIRRVLADDGTVWMNLGDSYSQTSTAGGVAAVSKTLGIRSDGTDSLGDAGRARAQSRQRVAQSRKLSPDVGPKNLLGMPWRTAFALQDDGWILRNAIIWNKPNAMPESVTDRLSTRYEMLFLFSKSRRYWFDLDPIREPLKFPEAADGSRVFGGVNKAADLHTGSAARRTGSVYGKAAGTNLKPTGKQHLTPDANGGRNPGDVWELPTVPFPGSHFAVFPPEIPRRCILAGCKPGGTVLDPFHGSGTTGMVAQRLGRKYVGIELNRDYLDLSLRTRLADGALPFDEESA